MSTPEWESLVINAVRYHGVESWADLSPERRGEIAKHYFREEGQCLSDCMKSRAEELAIVGALFPSFPGIDMDKSVANALRTAVLAAAKRDVIEAIGRELERREMWT